MKAAEYGHIIKHLETHHVDSLPIVCVGGDTRARFGSEAKEILNLRDRAYSMTVEAEELYERAFGAFEATDLGEQGFTSRAIGMFSGPRRLDAWHHNPSVKALGVHLARQAKGWNGIVELGFDVWLPTRFRRVAARDGVDFLDSSDLFEINPDITKRIADRDFRDPHDGRVAARLDPLGTVGADLRDQRVHHAEWSASREQSHLGSHHPYRAARSEVPIGLPG